MYNRGLKKLKRKNSERIQKMRYSKPTIYDPAFLPNNIYSGVPSFLNLPVLEHREELKGMDVAVMGVPWEGGCTIGGYSSCTE